MSTAFSVPAAVSVPAQSSQAIEYSRPGGVPLYLDASIPAGPGPFPAAIIVHGGGWVRGNRRTDVAPLFKPLEAAGIAWFSIDYRLLTNFTQLNAPVDDVRNAIRFVRENAAEFHIDPDRLALIGESAGGQLAAMAALDPKPDTRVQAVVAFYAPTDLVSLAQDSTLVPQQVRDSLRNTPFEGLLLAGLEQLSPLHRISAQSPPFLLIHGTKDSLVPFAQSQAMCDRLNSAGSSCELVSIEGGGHGMRGWESAYAAESRRYKLEMIRWLRRQLV